MRDPSGRAGVSPLIVAAAAAILVAVSNPPRAAYSRWLGQQAADRSGSGFAQRLVGLIGGRAAGMVGSATSQVNFVIGSIFRTKLDSRHAVSVLGVAGQFIPLTASPLG